MTALYLEPFGGLAGDMLLAALLDLERPAFTLADLTGFVDGLLPGACTLEASEVRRGALRGRLLEVRTPESAGAAAHRHLGDLVAIVERSPLGSSARTRALGVLERIARAEARVHGCTIEQVHFHEVGAVDTLVDVCGAAYALERLEVDEVYSAAPYVGGGSVRCAHGEMPVPAPGTAEILTGRAWRAGPGGERVTPTGAALLVELAGERREPARLRPAAIGYGAGARDPEEGPPNLVRVQLGALTRDAPTRAEVTLLEFNLDDATGEEIGFLLGELRRAGALEAWSAPVQMKKDRPGAIVSALCREEARAGLETVAFAHSPTLGVRWTSWWRSECERDALEVEVEGHRVRIQRRLRPGGGGPDGFDLSAEHDDLAAAARASGLSLREVERRALDLARRR